MKPLNIQEEYASFTAVGANTSFSILNEPISVHHSLWRSML